MLIDSGADISVITRSAGEELGLVFSKNDFTYEAGGVGGGIIQYILKQIEIQIDEHRLMIPVAWVLDENVNEMIIGRDKVFDEFDVEFKQKDEEIIFKKRKEV
jgi:Aspartyl protease